MKLKTRALGKRKVHVQVSSCEMESVDKSFDVQSLAVPDKPKKTIGSGGDGDYQFQHPGLISVCEANHILVADTDNKRIQEFGQ